MRNKVVFITGAAGGIGLEMARLFALEEACVMISDADKKKLEAAVSSLRRRNLKVCGCSCDVTDEAQVIAAIDETVRVYGRIDVLINNAGLQHVSPVEDFPTEKFRQLIDVMLVAPFLTAKHVFPLMKKRQYGRIINMASINGLVGFAGKAAYNSAKHGVIGLTKVLALEGAAHNITANALCPGYVDTDLVKQQLSDLANTRKIPVDKVMDVVIYPMVPQRRLLTTAEVANYALFLADEKAGGITGQAVVIDGGYTCQ